jgi:hypothetical protein
MKKILLVIIGIFVVWFAWYTISPLFRSIEMQEEIPSAAQSEISILAKGDFLPRAHEVKGSALLIQKDGEKILRFEDFETVNGPNLHIYLASNLEVKDYIDLGAIKATKGSVNYLLPIGTDTSKYNKVVVWCVPFKVLFSYAELK